LLRDFQRRCAYSQQHTDRSLGERTMEIDHFNPLLSGLKRHKYENLFLATRHCNGAKSDTWPTKIARDKGIRFLNPCEENDYGVHLFEHPVTHRLIGITPAGDFHITVCDLNATQFVNERADRAKIYDLLQNTPVTPTHKSKNGEVLEPIKLLREQFEKMIPLIAYLSSDHPKYQEELDVIHACSHYPSSAS